LLQTFLGFIGALGPDSEIWRPPIQLIFKFRPGD
jgi:hypothetical protein